MKDLTKGSIIKAFLFISMPILLGNIFNLLYSLADTKIIGTYLGDNALAAVGSVSTLSDLIIVFLTGISMGFGVVTARFFGQNDMERVKKSFVQSILIGIIITLIVMLGCLLGLPGLLKILHVEENLMGIAYNYMFIIIWGSVFVILYNVLAASLRAVGDAFTPLIFLIIATAVNIALDVIFVGVLGLSVEGAAYATVLAQAVSTVLCFIYTWKKYPKLRFEFKELKPEKKYIKQLISGGLSMGLMNSLVALGTLALQTAINTLGSHIIVAHMASRKMTNVFMQPYIAFGSGMAIFAGQNYGAGKLYRIKEGIIKSLIICFVWTAFVQLITYTIYPVIIQGLTNTLEIEIIENASLYQRVNTILYALVPTIVIFRNALQGMNDYLTPIISSTIELVGKIVFAYALTPIFAYWAIIMSEPVVWIAMLIPLIIKIIIKFKSLDTKNKNDICHES